MEKSFSGACLSPLGVSSRFGNTSKNSPESPCNLSVLFATILVWGFVPTSLSSPTAACYNSLLAKSQQLRADSPDFGGTLSHTVSPLKTIHPTPCGSRFYCKPFHFTSCTDFLANSMKTRNFGVGGGGYPRLQPGAHSSQTLAVPVGAASAASARTRRTERLGRQCRCRLAFP